MLGTYQFAIHAAGEFGGGCLTSPHICIVAQRVTVLRCHMRVCYFSLRRISYSRGDEMHRKYKVLYPVSISYKAVSSADCEGRKLLRGGVRGGVRVGRGGGHDRKMRVWEGRFGTGCF